MYLKALNITTFKNAKIIFFINPIAHSSISNRGNSMKVLSCEKGLI